MLYNSFSFIFGFLPVCLILYFGCARLSHGLANAVLAAMSLVFYGVWDWRDGRWDGRNLLLIVGSILLNFAAGAVIRRYRSRTALAAGSGEQQWEVRVGKGQGVHVLGTDPTTGGAVVEEWTADPARGRRCGT